MDPHTAPEPTRHDPQRGVIVTGPAIRRVFREVIADRLPDRRPPQPALLFGPADPSWDDDLGFLADLFNEILHQDTCQPDTADGTALLAPVVPPEPADSLAG
ncbi:hypothetical protein ACEZCY_13690 [Streptacidiphilus sp. N1-12]|uniref:Uncharacterized protein n=2 Tax=Streptacidiphilus alkalitolerans TaxID=3342712 RepID=A0ABV6WE18_9ACTN